MNKAKGGLTLKQVAANLIFFLTITMFLFVIVMNAIWFYKLGNGLEITEISKSDIEVIKKNVDFALSENTNFISAEYYYNLRDSTFYLIFYMPKEQVNSFIKSIEGNYIRKDNIFSSYKDEIIINGKGYNPIGTFVNKGRSFTAIQLYDSIDGNVYFQLTFDRPNQNISEYFEKKFNIGWKNLLT